MSNPETPLTLTQRIDDLSTRLLMGEYAQHGGSGPAMLLSALSELARQAEQAGCPGAAHIAGQLTASLAEGGSDEELKARMAEGLARLQEAVCKAGAAVPAPGEPDKPPASLAQDPELVADFVVESREHLGAIEQRLLTLERDPADAEAIHAVFRGFHTIKGLAGFLEFASIQEVAHEVETALNLAREGELAVTPEVIDVILECVDYLSRAISAAEAPGGPEQIPPGPGLLDRVRVLRTRQATPAPACPASDTGPEPARQPGRDPERPESAASTFSVRVDTDKLDHLVDMVGEMVIAQSLVRHNQTLAAAADPNLSRDLTQLGRITAEVQKTAMSMRMIPIGQLFQRTARHVRDLSRKVGKRVELATRGEDTEVDKTIAESLSDPLMHMVRNSIDHGIEEPAVRQAAGKPAAATITLAAYHQGGRIVIEVADDGRGMNTAKILERARQRGLVEAGAHLSESDIFRLILEPGFSTAEQVTEISGRGVGMDVVRRQVEKLRGRVEILSEAGRGTTFLLRMPLTLAIIDGLVVTVGRYRYIVPLFAVREMFRPSADAVFAVHNRGEMALVRGQLLPVLRLYRRLGLVPRTEDPCQALMIVAESEGHTFCLMVDDLVGKQEVVIKSLGAALGEVRGIAGGAILGDGRVGLILDVGGLWGGRAKG